MVVLARERGGLAVFGVVEESGQARRGRHGVPCPRWPDGWLPALMQPVLDRAYFLDDHLGASTNHLRFLVRLLLVASYARPLRSNCTPRRRPNPDTPRRIQEEPPGS